MNATPAKSIPQPQERIRLIGTPVGRMVRIDDFGDEIDPLQREQLHAYGLSAAHAVKVLQQQPMTVLLCEHVELAIEHAVSRHIWRAARLSASGCLHRPCAQETCRQDRRHPPYYTVWTESRAGRRPDQFVFI